MEENRGINFVLGLLVGTIVGAVIGILLAPRTGVETRRYLGEKAEEAQKKVAAFASDLREDAEEWIEKRRQDIDKGRERLMQVLQRQGKKEPAGAESGAEA